MAGVSLLLKTTLFHLSVWYQMSWASKSKLDGMRYVGGGLWDWQPSWGRGSNVNQQLRQVQSFAMKYFVCLLASKLKNLVYKYFPGASKIWSEPKENRRIESYVTAQIQSFQCTFACQTCPSASSLWLPQSPVLLISSHSFPHGTGYSTEKTNVPL